MTHWHVLAPVLRHLRYGCVLFCTSGDVGQRMSVVPRYSQAKILTNIHRDTAISSPRRGIPSGIPTTAAAPLRQFGPTQTDLDSLEWIKIVPSSFNPPCSGILAAAGPVAGRFQCLNVGYRLPRIRRVSESIRKPFTNRSPGNTCPRTRLVGFGSSSLQRLTIG